MSNFSHWTEADVAAHNRRVAGQDKAPAGTPALSAAAEKEIADVHLPIIRWCREHRAPYIHNRTDKKSGIAEGAPDFVIGYRGRTFWIECKARGGKLSEAQRDFAHLCHGQDLEHHVIWSFGEFICIMAQLDGPPHHGHD